MAIKDDAVDAAVGALKGAAVGSGIVAVNVISAGFFKTILFGVGLANPITATAILVGVGVGGGVFAYRKYKRRKKEKMAQERASRLRKAANALSKHGVDS